MTQVTCRPNRGMPTSLDRERELCVRSILEGAIMVSQYPRMAIHVILQITEGDGAELSTAINVHPLACMSLVPPRPERLLKSSASSAYGAVVVGNGRLRLWR
jgi:ribonuclease PH